MVFKRSFASVAGIVALLTAVAGCAAEGTDAAPTTPSAVTPTSEPKTVTTSPVQPVPTTASRPTTPTGPGSEYDVTCTGGPDEGTICTNPNHGAGDDPYGTGTVAPTSKPR